MKKIFTLFVALSSMIFIPSVQAAGDMYAGAGLGLDQLSSSGNLNGVSSGIGLGIAGKLGYRVNEYFSAEGSFTTTGKSNGGTNTLSSVSSSAITVDALFYFPLENSKQAESKSKVVSTTYSGYSDAAWYVLAGYGKLTTKAKNTNGVEFINASKNGLKLGAGFEVGHTSDLTFRIGVDTYDTSYVRVTNFAFSVLKKF